MLRNRHRTHPLFLMDHFVLDPFSTTSYPIEELKNTTEALAKMLVFGLYVKARTGSGNESVQAVIEQELAMFPDYARKEKFKVEIN